MKTKLIALIMALVLPHVAFAECALRQSTASQEVLIGPFVDSTDGVTAETALTIANTDIRLSPAGGNMVAKNSGGGTHDEIGKYQIVLDATDTATVGTLDIDVQETGAAPVFKTCYVYEENVFDVHYAAAADLGTLVEDIPTTAEFNARTLVSASYFDSTADAVANVTNVTTAPTNWSDLSITATTGRVDVGEWLGVAVTTLETVADFWANATRTLTAGTNLNDVSAADVNAQVDIAIVDARLNELMTATLGSQPTAGSLFGDLTGDDAGTQQFTTNALENAPSGSSITDWTAAERNEIRGRMGVTGTTAAGGNTPTLALEATLNAQNDLSQADVRTAVGLASANLDTQLAALPTAVEVRDALLSATIDGTIDLECAVALTIAYVSGDWDAPASIVTYRNPGDTADRIVGTTSATAFDATALTCP